MLRKIFFLACGLFLLAAVPSFGDWDPGMPAKWVQMPDLEPTGVDVNASIFPEDLSLIHI